MTDQTMAVRYCTPETCADPRCSNYGARAMKTLTISDESASRLRLGHVSREVVQQLTARRETLSWLGLPWIEVDIEVLVIDGRALVTKTTLQVMAYSIRGAAIAAPDEDAAYCEEILATPATADGLYDVTDMAALDDQLLELGIKSDDPGTGS